MRKYKSEGRFNIKDQGTVFAVRNDEDFKRDTSHLIGEQVEIDDKIYTVKGVESWCIETIREGAPIGLLVRE